MKQENLLQKKIEELENTKKAVLNLLEDLEKERNALQASNAKNEAILASIGNGLVVVDTNMRIMLINKAAEAATGWSNQDVFNKVWPEVIMVETEDGTKVPANKSPCFLAIHAKKTTTTTTTYYYTRKDKTKFPVIITVSPFKIKNKLIGAIVVFRDITREREIDKMQSEFISIVSHQLGTPLIGIQWTVERILKKGKLTIGLRGYLQDIRISVQRLAGLVSNLLSISRFEEGRLVVSLKQIELVAFIRDYVIEYTPLSTKKGIALTFEEYPKTLNIITDYNLLQNVIQSLVSNAVEYTPKGGKVKIFLQKKGSRFILMITDTGIGIPKKEQPTIFDKFTRGTNAKLIKPSGSGLGLYLIKQAVKILQGKIWFESRENKGTTFFVELPLKARSKKGSKHLA